MQFTNLSQSQSPVNYYWEFGDGITDTVENPNHTYDSTGNYTVRLITNYCSHSDTTEQTINIVTTKKGEHHFKENFEIFPNPADNKVTIKNNKAETDVLSIDLINSFGQSVISRKGGAEEDLTIQLDDLPAGFYIIRIKEELTEAEAYFKILKK